MTQKQQNHSISSGNRQAERQPGHSVRKQPRHALLLVGTHCPHCPAVMAVMSDLVKTGELASLEIVNLEQNPELAAELGVRSVPWARIGSFELEGLRSKAEYQQWIARAQQPDGVREYIETLLGDGEVSKVIKLIENDHDAMQWVFDLMLDPDAKINLRLGIGVLMEEFAASDWFTAYIPQLEKLCRHDDARVRADACHNLALTENPKVLPVLQSMLNDSSAEVREVAQDGLDALAG